MNAKNQMEQATERQQRAAAMQMVPHPYEGKALSAIIAEKGGAPVSNFDGDTMHKWKLRSIATGAGCKSFGDLPPGGIDLKYFFAHRIEMVSSRGGEIIEPIRVVLIDSDLNAYGFVSDGIPKDLDGIIQDFGWGPWCLPVNVTVTMGETRSKQKFYSLGPVVA